MDHEKEYWVFADESVQEGKLFSNFFGGCMVPARLHAAEIGFLKELKWQRVSEQWLDGYKEMIGHFFDELRSGDLRMRVMFRSNEDSPGNLSRKQRENGYYLLY